MGSGADALVVHLGQQEEFVPCSQFRFFGFQMLASFQIAAIDSIKEHVCKRFGLSAPPFFPFPFVRCKPP